MSPASSAIANWSLLVLKSKWAVPLPLPLPHRPQLVYKLKSSLSVAQGIRCGLIAHLPVHGEERPDLVGPGPGHAKRLPPPDWPLPLFRFQLRNISIVVWCIAATQVYQACHTPRGEKGPW